MVTKSVVIAVLCVGLCSIFESLMIPKALALRTNGFRMDDQRSQRRRNHSTIMSGKHSVDDFDTETETDSFPEHISTATLIFDYADTLNDEYILDKPSDTKKRSNTEWENKYQDQSLPDDTPCECKYIESPELLGDNIFPTSLVSRSCSNTPQLRSCPYPYKCEEIIYPVAILKMKPHKDIYAPSETIDLLPLRLRKLSLSWNIEYKNVSVGCHCTNKYVTSIIQ